MPLSEGEMLKGQRLLAEGRRLTDIAKILGRNYDAVYRALRDYIPIERRYKQPQQIAVDMADRHIGMQFAGVTEKPINVPPEVLSEQERARAYEWPAGIVHCGEPLPWRSALAKKGRQP